MFGYIVSQIPSSFCKPAFQFFSVVSIHVSSTIDCYKSFLFAISIPPTFSLLTATFSLSVLRKKPNSSTEELRISNLQTAIAVAKLLAHILSVSVFAYLLSTNNFLQPGKSFSSVANTQKVGSFLLGSVLVGGAERHMLTRQKKDSSNVSNHCNLIDGKHKADRRSSTLMHQTLRPKIKEAAREANCKESGIAAALEDFLCHHNNKKVSEVQQKITDFHKENPLSLSISKIQGEHQSVQYSDTTLGNLGAEKLSLQNLHQMSSELDISADCHTENVAGNMELLGNTSTVANSANRQKETGEKTVSKNKSRQEEIIGLEELSSSTSEKGGLSNPQHPVTHQFSILKFEDKLGNTNRQHHSDHVSTHNLPAATNNFPMKGLKHIPILQNSLEINASSEELAGNKASLSPSLTDGTDHGKKRKSNPYPKEQITDLPSNYSKPDLASKYCFKRHKVFADKVESSHQNLKTLLERKDMQESERLPPEALALESNRKNTTIPSITFSQVYPRPFMYGNCDVELGKICTATTNRANMTNSVQVQALHGSSQAITLGLGSTAYATGQVASVKNGSQRNTSPGSDWGKFLALSASSELTNQGIICEKKILANFEHRFNKLQAFLKRCDESDQYYSQRLQNLSSVDRSAIAVKLETRAIMLSLEEVKEIHRMNTLKIFGKTSEDATNDVGAASILKLLVPGSS